MHAQAAHRIRIDAKAAIWAGVIAGLVFVAAEMLMVAVFLGGSAWGPPRMIAAIVLGQEVLPPPATFDAVVVMVAMLIHVVLSILLGFVFAFITGRRSAGTAALVGALFGLVVYAINFYGLTVVFPWFAEARNWVSILAHLLFGMVLGVVYAVRAHGSTHTHRTT